MCVLLKTELNYTWNFLDVCVYLSVLSLFINDYHISLV